jgi:hypothetical protein
MVEFYFTLKVPAIERWKPLKYGVLKYKYLKENGIEMRQIVSHGAVSCIRPELIVLVIF